MPLAKSRTCLGLATTTLWPAPINSAAKGRSYPPEASITIMRRTLPAKIRNGLGNPFRIIAHTQRPGRGQHLQIQMILGHIHPAKADGGGQNRTLDFLRNRHGNLPILHMRAHRRRGRPALAQATVRVHSTDGGGDHAYGRPRGLGSYDLPPPAAACSRLPPTRARGGLAHWNLFPVLWKDTRKRLTLRQIRRALHGRISESHIFSAVEPAPRKTATPPVGLEFELLSPLRRRQKPHPKVPIHPRQLLATHQFARHSDRNRRLRLQRNRHHLVAFQLEIPNKRHSAPR